MTTTEYLQREIRRTELSIRRAERKPNTPPEELRGLHEKLEHLQEALKAVEEHWQRVHEQRGWTVGEPLTLERLRGMDGRPAYWPYEIVSRGMEVYAYQTAHIDREAWEPCVECEPRRLLMGDEYCPACGRPLTEEARSKSRKKGKR